MDLESDKAVTCQSLREPLLSEEFQTSNDDSRVQVKLRRFKIALIGSAATIIALAALSVVFYLQTLPRCQGIQTPSSVLLPEFPHRLVTFIEDARYTGNESTSAAVADAWADLLPKGRGSVKIDNPRQYALQPGVAIPNITNMELFKLSVFHQLHCLDILRVGYAALLTHNLRDQHATAAHMDHCFDYLRQGIMCASDTSLEWAVDVTHEVSSHGVDGWGVTHVCRDFTAVVAWAEKNRWGEASGIL